MKNVMAKIKWIAGQARPSVHYLFLIVIFGAILSLSSIYRAITLKKLIDSATASQAQQMLSSVIVFAVLILIDVGFSAAISVMTTHSSTGISNSIQKKLYNHLAKIDWLEYSKYHSGDILTRITSDVDTITGVLVNTIPNIISLAVMLVGSFITLLFFDSHLALIAILLAPVTVILSRLYARKIKKIYINIQKNETQYRSFLQETIQNMTIVKAFCLEEVNSARIDSLQAQKKGLALTRSRVSILSNSVFSIGSWLGFFIAFSWGALNLSRGAITFGTLTALLQLFGSVQGPFSGLAGAFPQIIYTLASAERLMELEALQLDSIGCIPVDSNTAGVQFENVSFGYNKLKPVLGNVSIKIHPGETVALIGPSGEGKTTFIRLLLSLIYPKKGHVYIINDQEKNAISPSTRKLVSYVPQGNTLFSGTIADNLRLGDPNATDKELETAIQAAFAWEFIENLPDGLYTVIGERGLGLSEGQAQRLAIARALLRKSPILILDEATSALDVNTEVKVLETIRNLSPKRTCIIITHRPTALQFCHRVLKLEDGHLTELYDRINSDQAIEAV